MYLRLLDFKFLGIGVWADKEGWGEEVQIEPSLLSHIVCVWGVGLLVLALGSVKECNRHSQLRQLQPVTMLGSHSPV